MYIYRVGQKVSSQIVNCIADCNFIIIIIHLFAINKQSLTQSKEWQVTRETSKFTDLAAYTCYINNVSSITNIRKNNKKAKYKKQNTKRGMPI